MIILSHYLLAVFRQLWRRVPLTIDHYLILGLALSLLAWAWLVLR